MDRSTTELINQSKHQDETIEQKIARIRSGLPAAGGPRAQTLPSSDDVPLVTLTLDELHDLVYSAASSYYREHTSATITHAQEAATRLAAAVVARTSGTDYLHHGTDPRG